MRRKGYSMKSCRESHTSSYRLLLIQIDRQKRRGGSILFAAERSHFGVVH